MMIDSALASNAEYLEQSYQAWKQDSDSVPKDLAHFFEGFEFAQSMSCGITGGKQSAADSLVYHYRDIGHRVAQINPLGDNPVTIPELELESFGLSEADLDTYFNTNHIPGIEQATLREIIDHLKATYCGFIGVEYMHIQDTAERRWLQERMEGTRNQPNYSRDHHLRILWKLRKAEMFEQYLHTTYRGQKRFSLEGAETLIPALDRLVENSVNSGVKEIVLGMAHRGRLNVLANILEKSYDDIFSEFDDNFQMDTTHGDGDVKYHKGFSKDLNVYGHDIHLSLTPNPSHLEMVGPVVEGKVRAKQAVLRDKERKTVLPFIIHGDAAFAGQGIVAETFNLSQLKGYRTGGTIHFIINNQVGFTTTAVDYLSGLYCTDVAKMMAIPIFHVNGDQPEHVLHCIDIATEYRQTFGKDVVLDMWCYRRHGHNEGDEPSFTQPLLYDRIRKHPSVDDLYAAELATKGENALEETTALALEFEKRLDEAKRQAAIPDKQISLDGFKAGKWVQLKRGYTYEAVETGASLDELQQVGNILADLPEGFKIHRVPREQMERIRKATQGDGELRWAEAELLAFGTLVMEGQGVRLSGEDSGRGTFSQRHAIIYDQKTGEKFIPLARLNTDDTEFKCYDSSLAELSVLAFEYGYSLGDPTKLILWEAQFGDFANGAQVIIDQFLAAGESKWNRMSGLVLLLPHGYEGQGPEHSNAWLSRYLSLSAEENLQVVNATTPAQYFHLLRRQVKRDFRTPLVIMTPKSLLRRPGVTSTIDELTKGSFQEIIEDPRGVTNARRLVLCCGKVYYDLMEKAKAEGKPADDVAIVRVEQLYPFHPDKWNEIAEKYENVKEWVWVSEEPVNYGAWAFMRQHLESLYNGSLWYVGRARSASPAVGSKRAHDRQQDMITSYALQPGPLAAELVDGVTVFTRGDKLWHMKSRSRRSANRSVKEPSHSG